MNPFQVFFFSFLFKAVVHPGSCGALILCVFDSQLSGSERCEPQRDLFVHHGPENAGTAARHASLGVDTKMFRAPIFRS